MENSGVTDHRFSLGRFISQFENEKIGLEVSEPVSSLIEEDRLVELLRLFYSNTESNKILLKLNGRRMSLAIMKGSVTVVKLGIFFQASDADWRNRCFAGSGQGLWKWKPATGMNLLSQPILQ